MVKLLSIAKSLRFAAYGSRALIYAPCSRNLQTSSLRMYADHPPMGHILKENNIPEADRKKIEEEVAEMTKV